MRSQPPALSLATALVLAVALSLSTPAWAADKVEVLAVTASSTDGMLMDAVDGDATTMWQNKREGERDAWLAVRFAQLAKLKGLRLHTEPMPADTTFDVETSPDGETYVTVLKHQRLTADKPADLTFLKKVSALYLRVRFHYTGAKQAPRFRIKELEPIGG